MSTDRPPPGWERTAAARPLLRVDDLAVVLPTPAGPVAAVRGVSFSLAAGEALALVGESGSGKTTILLALLGLLPTGALVSGTATCDGEALVPATEERLRTLRGRRLGAVFQDPSASLDPTMRIGRQVAEGARLHLRLSGRTARGAAADLLARLGLPGGAGVLRRYPHELSGGMRQRVALAMALAAGPRLLLADEPTGSLDPTLASDVADLLRDLCAERGMGLLLVTHDLGLAARLADQVVVLYAGRAVERGAARQVLAGPAHPYTEGLVRALPGARPGQPLQPIPGAPPDPRRLPQGCAFAPRCPHAMRGCTRQEPAEYALPGTPARSAACWLHDPRAPAGVACDGGR